MKEVGVLLGVMALAVTVYAVEPVTVREGTLPIQWRQGDFVWQKSPGKNNANYVDTSTYVDKGEWKLKTIELENRYLRVIITPESGGQVAQIINKADGCGYFQLSPKGTNDLVGWPTGVKASFPYKELGIRLGDQPASYTVTKNTDGSATVSLWMEFSRWDGAWNQRMYGRYGNMLLSQHVTLKPDTDLVEIRYRIINPTPYRQGRQFWANATFPRQHTKEFGVAGPGTPRQPKSDTEWIFPAAYVSSHSGADYRQYSAEEMPLANLQQGGKSVFAWAIPYGFAGLWYPDVQVNRLRLTDPKIMPGAKQYFTKDGDWGASLELWSGTDSVFEQVGNWIEPGEAIDLPVKYAYVSGIGKASYANEQVALHVAFGGKPVVEAVTLRPVGKLQVSLDGKVLGEAACAPDKPARFTLPAGTTAGRITVRADGQQIADEAFPLELKADEAAYARIRETLSNAPENDERLGNAEVLGRCYRKAMDAYQAGTTAKGRLLYRDGQLDQAIGELLEATASDPADGEAWHLLGAALLESGQRAGARSAFRRALAAARPYVPARYFLALDAMASRQEDRATQELTQLIAERPNHWEGRLLLAYLEATGAKVQARSADRAAALAAEDPGDPRAQYVLWRAAEAVGKRDIANTAKATYEALITEPGTARRMEEFQAALKGEYKHPARLKH